MFDLFIFLFPIPRFFVHSTFFTLHHSQIETRKEKKYFIDEHVVIKINIESDPVLLSETIGRTYYHLNDRKKYITILAIVLIK